LILVANGCSHTAGAEIEHVYQRRCYKKAWPLHLSELLGYEHVNLSDSGASAHRVVRTTIRYVLDCIAEKQSLRDHLFIIAWPGAYRTELFNFDDADEDEKLLYYDDGWLPLVVGNDEQYKKTFPSKIFNYYKYWVTNKSRVDLKLDYLHNIMFLQNFFQLYKINFLFWEAATVQVDYNHPQLMGYKNLIYKKTFPYFGNHSMCFTSLLKDNNQSISEFSIKGGFASHYDEFAQQWFANYIHSYLARNSFL